MSLLGELLNIDGVAVTAVGDVVPQRVAAAQARVVAKGQPSPAGYSKSETDFENLCQRDDVDLAHGRIAAVKLHPTEAVDRVGPVEIEDPSSRCISKP